MKTIIFNYYKMVLGGIETGFAQLMSYSMNQGYRTIWITDKKHYQEASFRDVVDDARLEKVFVNAPQKLLGKLPSALKFGADEEIVMLTCQMDRFILGERIRKKVKASCFQHYLLLAHFTGKYDFPEQWFEGKIMKRHVLKYLKSIANKCVLNDCVRAFSIKHLDAFEKAYNVVIENKAEKLWGRIELVRDFPLEEVEKKAAERNQKFNIITCARFEFPHKGYLMGLIDKYAIIKKAYPQTSLTIVGYGEGEKELKCQVDKLDEQVKSDIRFTGMLTPAQFNEELKSAHLNIGVAGSLRKGIQMGVPSLSCRHYSYECETYGFWGSERAQKLSVEPGEDIIPYIKKSIECPNQDYVDCVRESFEIKREEEIKSYNPNYFFEQKGNYHSIINKKDFFKAVVLQVCINLKK